MHNIEYTSDQMDLDTGDMPDPLDLRPMPASTSDGPYLNLSGPSPDGGIDGTVTMNFSPPHHTSRPRSHLDRLIRIENGSESEKSEESSSEESASPTEDCPIPVHPISGGGNGPCCLISLLLGSPILLRVI